MLRLFGPTRVSGGSGPRLPRAAFLAVALLDLAPSRVMTREALAARLWEGAAAVKANASLRQSVSRIRIWEEQTGRMIEVVDSTGGAPVHKYGFGRGGGRR